MSFGFSPAGCCCDGTCECLNCLIEGVTTPATEACFSCDLMNTTWYLHNPSFINGIEDWWDQYLSFGLLDGGGLTDGKGICGPIHYENLGVIKSALGGGSYRIQGYLMQYPSSYPTSIIALWQKDYDFEPNCRNFVNEEIPFLSQTNRTDCDNCDFSASTLKLTFAPAGTCPANPTIRPHCPVCTNLSPSSFLLSIPAGTFKFPPGGSSWGCTSCNNKSWNVNGTQGEGSCIYTGGYPSDGFGTCNIIGSAVFRIEKSADCLTESVVSLILANAITFRDTFTLPLDCRQSFSLPYSHKIPGTAVCDLVDPLTAVVHLDPII